MVALTRPLQVVTFPNASQHSKLSASSAFSWWRTIYSVVVQAVHSALASNFSVLCLSTAGRFFFEAARWLQAARRGVQSSVVESSSRSMYVCSCWRFFKELWKRQVYQQIWISNYPSKMGFGMSFHFQNVVLLWNVLSFSKFERFCECCFSFFRKTQL